VPGDFRALPDDAIWWPRNEVEDMARLSAEAGWEVVMPDVGVFERDGVLDLLDGPPLQIAGVPVGRRVAEVWPRASAISC